MGLLDEIQKKLEEAARQASGGGMSVDTGGNDDIPNPWPQNPTTTTQQQQIPNIPTQPAPQPQMPNQQQQYQQQYSQLVQQMQQTAQQIFQLGYQYGVQTAQGVIRSGLMDNPEEK